MSRSTTILLGVVIVALLLVILVLLPHQTGDIEHLHEKHHGHNPNLFQTVLAAGERKIDKEPLHLDEQQQEIDDETTTKDKKEKYPEIIVGDAVAASGNEEEEEERKKKQKSTYHPTSKFRKDLMNKLQQPLLPKDVLQLYSGSVMPKFLNKKIDLANANQEVDTPEGKESIKYLKRCPEWREKDSGSNVQFAYEFSRILREKFPPEKGGALDGSGLHWFLDEGGLIGSSRAGSLRNADDDFDFFLLLPNLHQPCKSSSLTCTKEEYDAYIHNFLMVFHNEGMCINKFSPDPKRFKSRSRLMFSFQLNRGNANPESCFQEHKPFAHMHLGIFDENGKVCTNVWIPPHSTHTKDKLDLKMMLPVTRCRAGSAEVPCPQNITGFLTERNQGEYRRRSSDGSCLVVKKKWGAARKKTAAETLKELDKCGYNSIVDLLPEFERSGYRNC